jgi:type IV fimbrial biogenesis protein FimT
MGTQTSHTRRRLSSHFGPAPRQAGYSLHDLIVTSAVVGALATGTPAMMGMVQSSRMTAEVNELMAHLSLARSEAIMRGTTVTICKSKDGVTCSNDSEWRNGWIVFTDPNENHQVDADESIVYTHQTLHGSVALRYGGEKETYRYLTYHPPGYARPNATFTFCDGHGSTKAKAVIINPAGRPRSSDKNKENKPLDCAWT